MTKRGDDGYTDLLLGGRSPKNCQQIQTIGSIDELNAFIGLAKAYSGKDYVNSLELIQLRLVQIMGELAVLKDNYDRWTDNPISKAKLTDQDLTDLESWATIIEGRKPSFKGWATPGASIVSAHFDIATRVCRRAEREILNLADTPNTNVKVRKLIVKYINRLSDYLWLLARVTE